MLLHTLTKTKPKSEKIDIPFLITLTLLYRNYYFKAKLQKKLTHHNYEQNTT